MRPPHSTQRHGANRWWCYGCFVFRRRRRSRRPAVGWWPILAATLLLWFQGSLMMNTRWETDAFAAPGTAEDGDPRGSSEHRPASPVVVPPPSVFGGFSFPGEGSCPVPPGLPPSLPGHEQHAVVPAAALDWDPRICSWRLRPDHGLGGRSKGRKFFCLPWEVSADEWWLRHPSWRAAWESDDDTGYCFRFMADPDRAALFRSVHRSQHPSDGAFFGYEYAWRPETGSYVYRAVPPPHHHNATVSASLGDDTPSMDWSPVPPTAPKDHACSRTISKPMMQSGWGADLAHVLDGLLRGRELGGVPFQPRSILPWHYTAAKKTKTPSDPVCPHADLSCYFLPLSSCPPSPPGGEREFVPVPGGAEFWHGTPPTDLDDPTTAATHNATVSRQPSFLRPAEHRWLLEYATRPQAWLRRRVLELSASIPLDRPCAALHVRRADVVLHGKHSRRYHSIHEYIEGLKNITTTENVPQTLFLLTDDENAIEEATTEYPDYEWVYVPRPRFQGAQGGWENQIPSEDPAFEVVVLLAILRRVTDCDVLVYSYSNLAYLMAGRMLEEHQLRRRNGGFGRQRKRPLFKNLDGGKRETEIFSLANERKPPPAPGWAAEG